MRALLSTRWRLFAAYILVALAAIPLGRASATDNLEPGSGLNLLWLLLLIFGVRGSTVALGILVGGNVVAGVACLIATPFVSEPNFLLSFGLLNLVAALIAWMLRDLQRADAEIARWVRLDRNPPRLDGRRRNPCGSLRSNDSDM